MSTEEHICYANDDGIDFDLVNVGAHRTVTCIPDQLEQSGRISRYIVPKSGHGHAHGSGRWPVGLSSEEVAFYQIGIGGKIGKGLWLEEIDQETAKEYLREYTPIASYYKREGD